MAFLAPAIASILPALGSAGSAGTAALGAAAPTLASAAAPTLGAYAMPAGAKALGSAMPWLTGGTTTAASMAGPGAMNLSAMPNMIGKAAGSLPDNLFAGGFQDTLMKNLPNMMSALQGSPTSSMSMPSAPAPNYSQNSNMSLTDMLNQRAQQRLANNYKDMDDEGLMSMFNNRLG